MADTLTADTEPGLPPMVAGAQATSTGAKHELEQRERPRARPQERQRQPAPSRPPAFIDCDLHNELDSTRDLYPYLSKRWRDHLDTYGASGPNAGWYPRFLDHREESRPPSGRIAGSELEFTRTDFIEPHHVAYGILNPLGPAGSQLNHELGGRAGHGDQRLAGGGVARSGAAAAGVDRGGVGGSGRGGRGDPPPRRRQAVRAGAVQGAQPGADGAPQVLADLRGLRRAYVFRIHVASHAFGQYGFPITGAGCTRLLLHRRPRLPTPARRRRCRRALPAW